MLFFVYIIYIYIYIEIEEEEVNIGLFFSMAHAIPVFIEFFYGNEADFLHCTYGFQMFGSKDFWG